MFLSKRREKLINLCTHQYNNRPLMFKSSDDLIPIIISFVFICIFKAFDLVSTGASL